MRDENRRAEKDDPIGALGLYGPGHNRYSTPVALFGVVVVGLVFCLSGVLGILGALSSRAKEFERFGTTESHWVGFFFSAMLIVVGGFLAHPGVIYFGRRILRSHRTGPH